MINIFMEKHGKWFMANMDALYGYGYKIFVEYGYMRHVGCLYEPQSFHSFFFYCCVRCVFLSVFLFFFIFCRFCALADLYRMRQNGNVYNVCHHIFLCFIVYLLCWLSLFIVYAVIMMFICFFIFFCQFFQPVLNFSVNEGTSLFWEGKRSVHEKETEKKL